MKTHTIKTPTSELLIVEPPISWGLVIGEEALLIYDHTKKTFGKTHTFNGHYTLLGKPDEIIEEDAVQLVQESKYMDFDGNSGYVDYKVYPDGLLSAKDSLLSLLESEIYWDVNPFSYPNERHTKDGINVGVDIDAAEAFHEAELRTFDRKRSLIFKKN